MLVFVIRYSQGTYSILAVRTYSACDIEYYDTCGQVASLLRPILDAPQSNACKTVF
jgi:hypothetical protein